MTTTLIVGAGRLGTRLATRRLLVGDRVLAMNRTPRRALPEGCVPLLGDVTSSDAFADVSVPVHQLVYCVSPDDRSPLAYQQAFTVGLNHLLAWLKRTRQTPRMLFVSSTRVYGQNGGEWVDEDSPTDSTRPLSRILLEAEQLVHRSSVEGIVLRLGGLYGDSLGLLERVPRGDSSVGFANRIHLTDATSACDHLLRLRSPAPLYLGVDDEPAPQRAVIDWMSERLGRAIPAAWASLSNDTVSGKRCRNLKLKRSGFVLQYPSFRTGYLELLPPLGS